MPEMPEVETIARKLRKAVVGKRIAGVTLSGLPLRRPVGEEFAVTLTGRTIRGIRRRGKYLIAELEPRSFWLIHLGMSGRIVYTPLNSERKKHTHAVIQFTDRTELQYCDHRRFGLLSAYPVSRIREIPELKLLGKDPLSAGFSAGWLKPLLVKCTQEIKAFLLDQRRVAGLGNIYVCEVLFDAGIHPSRRCHTINDLEIARIVRGTRKVLRAAIRHRGTSFSDFMDSDGLPGDHQSFLRVFQREGEKCGRCRSIIRRMRQGNRSSFYCPRCQK
jgi:formamidopyrimidine-DNA glycosylase